MKQNNRNVPITLNPSRAHKTKTRLMRRLILALAILSLSTFSMHTEAQIGQRRAPLPTEKQKPRRPDLVATSDIYPQSEGLCRFGGSNDLSNPYDLLVFVENRSGSGQDGSYGGGDAADSRVEVWFKTYSGSKVTYQIAWQPVPGIPRGGRETVRFRVPNACFDPVSSFCFFKIYVDSLNQVAETHENNNLVTANCPHP